MEDLNTYLSSGIIESYVLGLASTEERMEVERLSAFSYTGVLQAIEEFSIVLKKMLFPTYTASTYR